MAENFFEVKAPSHDVELYKDLTAMQETDYSEGFSAAVKSGFRTNISSMAYDKVSSLGHSIFNNEDMMSPEEANEEFEPLHEFTEPISRYDATIRKEREEFLSEQEAIMREAGLGGVSRFAGSFVGGVADPVTALASAATAGLGGIAARSIISAGTYVKTARALQAISSAKLGGDIVKELAESAIVAAAIEIPLAENLENVYGEDVGAKEHMFNIATGAAAGVILRSIGRVYTNAKSKPGAVDPDRTTAVVTRELDESANTGKAPNPERAMEADRVKVRTEASDPKRINDAAKITENFDDTDGVYFSTHQAGADNLAETQVKYGTSLGEGMYMVSNPALANAKAAHLSSADVIKYRPNEMKLLDLDETASPDIKFEEFAKTELPAVVSKALDEGSSLKNILSIVDDLNDAKPELGLQQKVNDFFKEKGFDGYKYKEDFFEGEEAISDAIFIFDPPKLQDSAISRHTFDESNRTPVQPSRDIDPEPRMTPEQAFKEDRNEFPEDSVIYEDESFKKMFDDTFKDEFIEAPDTKSQELFDEVAETLEVVRELAEQSEGGNAKLKKILEDAHQELADVERMIKASIACGRGN